MTGTEGDYTHRERARSDTRRDADLRLAGTPMGAGAHGRCWRINTICTYFRLCVNLASKD